MLGGRSFGGRICSVAVAEGQPAAGLVLLSYPLHPPGRPDRLRVEHLGLIDVPVLAVSGASDPFGSPDELEAHLAAVRGPLTHLTVAGPHVPRDVIPVATAVATWITGLTGPAISTSGRDLACATPDPDQKWRFLAVGAGGDGGCAQRRCRPVGRDRRRQTYGPGPWVG